ncbi:hypothetical protein ElyMa_002707800 [Elysia marginata]|uniref:Uncharacterized protein n=1 Tax=Elysia marginata TaxID=1093978 RepID=A0AAV4HFT7_9GAST|nr:hypothetical protein ElyMa_002707800 [Elysia marginata]
MYSVLQLKCCGITDRWDFQDVKDFGVSIDGPGNSTIPVHFLVAPTCCKRHIFKHSVSGDGSQSSINKIIECGESTSDAVSLLYTTGCFTVIVDYIMAGCKYYAVVVWIHLADTGLHSYLYRKKVTHLNRLVVERTEKHNNEFVKGAVNHLNQQPVDSQGLGGLFRSQKFSR